MLWTKICAFFMSIVSFFNILFSGFIMYTKDNRIFLDQYYTDAKIERQTYDLVFPKNASGDLGLVLCIHGGGWNNLSKDVYKDDIIKVSEEKGLACACVNYRYVSKDVGFGDILDDITSALTAIKAKAAEYGVNLNKMLVTGGSAGGHLSLMYAYSRKAEAPIEPVCVVENCGPTDFTDPFYFSDKTRVGVDYFLEVIGEGIGYNIDVNDLNAAKPYFEKYSPINYVDANTVPTAFGHGENDDVVPYQNSIELKDKLTKYGVEHTFISFPNSNHECEDKESMSKLMQLFFDYCDKYLK